MNPMVRNTLTSETGKVILAASEPACCPALATSVSCDPYLHMLYYHKSCNVNNGIMPKIKSSDISNAKQAFSQIGKIVLLKMSHASRSVIAPEHNKIRKVISPTEHASRYVLEAPT